MVKTSAIEMPNAKTQKEVTSVPAMKGSMDQDNSAPSADVLIVTVRKTKSVSVLQLLDVSANLGLKETQPVSALILTNVLTKILAMKEPSVLIR